MTDVASSSRQTPGFTEADLLSKPQIRLPPTVNTSRLVGEARIDTFSPVNQNGSFEFDRVLKSGEVYKRTKKTKQWKKIYLVLRPNLLSAYKTSSEERLHKQISLSDLNAVAELRDPKGRREHLFSLYTPARNYHFQAIDEKDARSWVELIRKEARIDEEEQGLFGSKPPSTDGNHEAQASPEHQEQERFTSSSPEPIDIPGRASMTKDGIKLPGVRRPSTHNLDYSGDEAGTYSDWSDTPQQSYAQAPHNSLAHRKMRPASGLGPIAPSSAQTGAARNASHSSGFQIQDDERVVWHGYLLILKSTGAVRQWKKLWAVLRPKNLAFYKNDEEYAAQLIVPLSNIISAVEIDPLSRNHAAERILSRFSRVLSKEDDPELIEFIKGHVRSFPDAATGEEDWDEAMANMGIKAAVRNQIMLPAYQDLRETCTALDWVLDTVDAKYHYLKYLSGTVLGSSKKTGQGFISPWETELLKGGGKKRLMAAIRDPEEPLNTIRNRLEEIRSAPRGDFSPDDNLLYFSNQREVAYFYAEYARHRYMGAGEHLLDVGILHVILPEGLLADFVELFGDTWREFVMYCRLGLRQDIPDHLRYLTETPVIIGPVLKANNAMARRLVGPSLDYKNLNPLRLSSGATAMQHSIKGIKLMTTMNQQSRLWFERLTMAGR
ncbi:MAG: hypothetical protein Q9225_003712 [Loekoesia sp. 1 TL-2023]